MDKKTVAGQSELSSENQQLKDRVSQLETEREILKCPAGAPVKHFQPGDLTLHYDLIQTLAHEFNVETLCAVLGVSRTAYYRYRKGQSYQPTAEKKVKDSWSSKYFSYINGNMGVDVSWQNCSNKVIN